VLGDVVLGDDDADNARLVNVSTGKLAGTKDGTGGGAKVDSAEATGETRVESSVSKLSGKSVSGTAQVVVIERLPLLSIVGRLEFTDTLPEPLVKLSQTVSRFT
jgi:hypothetical protein